LTDEEFARRRRRAEDPAFLVETARANDITVEQARLTLRWVVAQLAPLDAQERDVFMANVVVVNHMLHQPPGHA
jgi:hypothetical protein